MWTRSASEAEVVNKALLHLQRAVESVKDGNVLLERLPDGTIREFKAPELDHARLLVSHSSGARERLRQASGPRGGDLAGGFPRGLIN